MSESTEPHPEKERKWPMRLAKTVFFVLAFFLVIFTVMANMGGSSDAMRAGVEDYFTAATGYPTHIEKLNRMTFFPRISVNVEGVEMHRGSLASEPVIMIGKLDVAMGFTDMAFSTGKIRYFNVDQLSAVPGTLFTQAIYLERARINDQGEGETAFFEGFGQIGEAPISFQMDMIASGSKKNRRYKLPAEKPFTLALGDLGFQGVLNQIGETIDIKDIRLRMPEKVAAGRMIFSGQGERKTHLETSMNLGKGTDITGNIVIDRSHTPWTLTGNLVSQTFDAADFAQGSNMVLFSQKLMKTLGREGESIWSIPAADVALNVKTEKTIQNGQNVGPVSAHLIFKDATLDLGALNPVLDSQTPVIPQKPAYGPYQ